ncbi:polysaccharide lyase [Nemania serpens]|nr:polysaccharide lyase [Nemania serpens]
MLSHTLTRLLCALGAAAATVQASQTFSNTGTMSGWEAYTRENKGTVQEVTNVVYKGTTALKMTQVYTPGYTGRYHSEAVKYNVYKKGDTGFYGFAFRLQEDWEFSGGSYNIAQFIADFTDLGCEETYMPSTLIWIDGNRLSTRVKYGNVCPTSQQQTRTFSNVATVTAGAWHRVELQVSWKSDSTGYFKLWFDGQKVSETYNIPTNVGDGRPFQFRVGLYANGWHDSGYQGSQATRQIWYDQISAGSVFADADPGAW